MSERQSPVGGVWLDETENELSIDTDIFEDIASNIRDLIKTAKIASITTRFEDFSNPDVTLIIESISQSDVRIIEFKLKINNWKSHVGGSSVYSQMENNVAYQKTKQEPTEYMYELGSFYHYLQNNISDLLSKKRGLEFSSFTLDEYTDKYVIYKSSITVSKFDDI